MIALVRAIGEFRRTQEKQYHYLQELKTEMKSLIFETEKAKKGQPKTAIIAIATSLSALLSGIVGLVMTLRKSGPELEKLELEAEKLKIEVAEMRRKAEIKT